MRLFLVACARVQNSYDNYKFVCCVLQGITCICDEATEELMWGLQNLMHVLVPEEKSEFSKHDRKYHSKKLLGYLHDNVRDFDIKQEMVRPLL